MSGPHRNADKVNTIGIVVVGICGAVLVYVSIVALQAFYMSDTSEVNQVADFGGQDIASRTLRADQQASLNAWQHNTSKDLDGHPTVHVGIDFAMKAIVDETSQDRSKAATLVPAMGASDVPLIDAKFGRPSLKTPGATPPPATPVIEPDQGSAAGAPDAGSGSPTPGPAEAGSGSAAPAPAAGSAAPMTPTNGTAQGGGPPAGAGPSPDGQGSGTK